MTTVLLLMGKQSCISWPFILGLCSLS